MTRAPDTPRSGTAVRLLVSFVIAALLTFGVLGVLALLPATRDLALATLRSPLAVLFVIVAIAVAVGLRFGVTRWTGSPLAGRIAGLIPVLAVLAWAVVVPALQPEADDPAPGAAPVAPAAGAPPGGQPAAATELGRAPLQRLDYAITGSAVVIDSGGAKTLRLENFSVQQGPDFVVYLVPSANAQSPEGGTLLGELKERGGSKNYAIPASARASGPTTALIWCRAFRTGVGYASLALP